jgi:hypothetical protein
MNSAPGRPTRLAHLAIGRLLWLGLNLDEALTFGEHGPQTGLPA